MTGSRLRTHFDEILKDGWDRKFDIDYDGQGFGAPQGLFTAENGHFKVIIGKYIGDEPA